MRPTPEYYEFYGELIKSNIFLKRLVLLLVGVNLGLAFLAYLGFTRPVQTFLVKEGYAYATTPYGEARSVHEVRQFALTFAKNLLEFNRENFNEHIKTALQMCSTELEVLMYNTIKTSEIPKIVQNTPGTVKFNVEEIRVSQGDPFSAYVAGQQVFPGQPPIPLRFTLTINVVNRTESNPFGLRIINYTQEKT
ncbi:MAG: hypothetical protein ONB48_09655 [candidate division KSB1 bacterium]|nr:hypothetical protein [candidate division KSB1 bacterium]MDZ7273752.1 hypothetical protein [candidate division KSB1 bacterium]MDZ7285908.1 hypothetical protein [candidate division KSB1 bacterium]MDZ7298940.1 hypothetical protein [candidate division KSB1 bacterium]MDZ7307616.1 hypothetical protein [candidate division KSB1 bacterium]